MGMYVCISLCEYVHKDAGAHGGQKSPRAAVTDSYALPDVGSRNQTWILSARAVCALN